MVYRIRDNKSKYTKSEIYCGRCVISTPHFVANNDITRRQSADSISETIANGMLSVTIYTRFYQCELTLISVQLTLHLFFILKTRKR